MKDLDLASRQVLIRQDLNVPVADGKVTSDQRIRASLPTIRLALEQGAAVVLMSHLGRPREGEFDEQYSLEPVAHHLSSLLGRKVSLQRDYLDGEILCDPGEVMLLENVRFNVGEKANNAQLARRYASLCDVFVMDAFGTAHRAQASTHGVAQYAEVACAGPLLLRELDGLGKALDKPARPMIAIVGGAKVSTKLTVLDALSDVVDQLVPGGGIANTFIAAAGYNVGKSLFEPDLLGQAKALMNKMAARGATIPVPVDVVVGKAFDRDTVAEIREVGQVADDDMIFDIGPVTARQYASLMQDAGTIVWNGPLGVFEFPQFSEGTKVVGEAIAGSAGFSIAGGGDTLAAVDQFGLVDNISCISTGGGAFLEFLEGKKLPAVQVLEERGNDA